MLLIQSPSRSVQFTLAFTVCLSAFAVDVSLPAIPDILQHFQAPDVKGHQVIGFYLIGFAAGQIPLGFLSDRYGRLPVFYASVLLFILVSAVTAFAESIEVLLWARLIQGFAGAGGPVLSRAIARDISGGKDLARLTALLVAALAISTLAAPVFGAVLMELWGWRATFALSLAMGVLSLLFFVLFVRETNQKSAETEGLVRQFVVSVQSFVSAPKTLWAVGLVSLTFFAYMAIVSGISQVVVDVYGMPSRNVAFVFGGAVFFYLLATQVGRQVLDAYSSLKLVGFGLLGYLLSALMCAFMLFSGYQDFWFFWWSLIPFLLGMGLVYSNATSIALEPLPRTAGFAASILGTVQIVSAAIGALIVGYFYERTVASMVWVLLIGNLSTFILFWSGLRLLQPGTEIESQ